MIKSFADRETELIWSGRRSRRLPADMQAIALRKLRLLHAARLGEPGEDHNALALMWIAKAAAHGHVIAREQLAALLPDLSDGGQC